jgi:hypothetical protein
MPKEIRNSKPEWSRRFGLRVSDFFRISGFGFSSPSVTLPMGEIIKVVAKSI